MTPQEHLDRAEHLLSVAEAATPDMPTRWVPVNLQAALAHAVIALAAELGVPHAATQQGGQADGNA